MCLSNQKNVLQTLFINKLRKEKIPVTIFLVNGVKLEGIITWFDNFCVLLRREKHQQLVYKHAISTISPVSPIGVFTKEEEAMEECEQTVNQD